MTFKLFPYQHEGIAHLASPLRASYLADKPGLGKTIQAIEACRKLDAKSVLVLSPASIVHQWQEHLRAWPKAIVISYDAFAVGNNRKEHFETLRERKQQLEMLKQNPHPQDDEWRRAIGKLSTGIQSIERTMKRRAGAKELRNRIRANAPYDVVVLDEAHYLKERGAYRTGYAFHPKHGLAVLGKKIMLLSGTPMLNRPAELYAMLRACYPEALHDCPSFEAYGYKFCGAATGFNNSMEYKGASNEEELGARLKPFMLARGLEVLGSRLPGVTYHDQKIPIVDTDIDEGEHVATLRRLTGEAKVDLLVQDIFNVSEGIKKLVVFYYHESVRRALQRRFPNSPLIKGGLTSYQKTREIERFVKLHHGVMLVQLGAGGVGLDGLQHVCNTGYIAELDWTPALEEQAVGRLRRLGQKEHVIIYRPVATRTGLDESMDNLNRHKSKLIGGIMKHVTSLFDGDIPMSYDGIEKQLKRIANALESMAGGTLPSASPVAPEAEPAKAPAKKGKAKKAGMTLEQAREQIKAELHANPSLSQGKKEAYDDFCAEYGVKNVSGVAEEELEAFVNSAITAMQNVDAQEDADEEDDV